MRSMTGGVFVVERFDWQQMTGGGRTMKRRDEASGGGNVPGRVRDGGTMAS